MKSIFQKIGGIPHLFSKIIVIWCITFSTAACAWSLRILSRTGHDPAALLGVIVGFFGGELLILCLRKIQSDKKEKKIEEETV